MYEFIDAVGRGRTPTLEGPVELSSHSSRISKLTIVALAAAFWNGVLYLGISTGGYDDAVEGFGSRWSALAFFAPFVLVGLAWIGFVAYYSLPLFNPRAHLRISSARIPLGHTLDLEWRMSGRTAAVQRLQIHLVGTEEVTYERGSTTRTDTHVFHKMTVLDTTHAFEIPRGGHRVPIPPDTMHTFDAPHNKILWRLQVKGAVRRWLDIDDEFTIELLPRVRQA